MTDEKLPDDACAYWKRQAFYDADDSIGGGEFTPDESLCAQREQLDQSDPPCGGCTVCVAQSAEPDEPTEEQIEEHRREQDALRLAAARKRESLQRGIDHEVVVCAVEGCDNAAIWIGDGGGPRCSRHD